MKINLAPPKLGGRTFKTLLSVTIIAVVYSFFDRSACFACIGAVFGLGNTLKGGLRDGGNRFIGTLTGGLVALPFYWIYHSTPFDMPPWLYLPIGIFVIIYICQIFNIHGGIQPGSVMFFVTLYLVPEATYISYVVARILDTGVGVALSLLINKIWPSPFESLEDSQRTDAPAAVSVSEAGLSTEN